MPDKVDIRVLYQLPMENLGGLNKLSDEEISRRFQGTDLIYDFKSKTLKRHSQDSEGKEITEQTTIKNEAERLMMIRRADANGDGWLNLTESEKLLADNLPQGARAKITPEKFLEGLQKMIAGRYSPLASNIQEIDGKAVSMPLILLLKEYNIGIYQDEVRHANSVLPLNGLTKSATNIGSVPVVAVHNIFTGDDSDWNYMGGTYHAKKAAKSRFERANTAIDNLEKAFEAGTKKRENWALNGDLNEALAHLGGGDREIITDQLAGKKLYSIISNEDAGEKFKLMAEFAEGERPEFLGYFGGNTSDASFWNYTGRKNNIYFAKSIYHYLAKKAKTGTKDTDDTRQLAARSQLDDIKGDGGNFSNVFWWGASRVFSLGGTFFEPTEYRAWGDLDSMNGVGRFANGALMLWGGNNALKGVKEAWNLRRVHGTGEVLRVWWRNKSAWDLLKLKPMPTQAFAKAAAAERSVAAELSRFDRAINTTGKVVRWPFKQIWRPFGWIGSKVVGKMPISPATQAAAANVVQKGDSYLVRGVLLLGIVTYADEKQTGPISPFEMGFKRDAKRTMNINRPKRLQDFDGQLYGGKTPSYDADLYEKGRPKKKPTKLGD